MIPLNLYQKLFLTMKASTFVEYIPLATDFVQWFFYPSLWYPISLTTSCVVGGNTNKLP